MPANLTKPNKFRVNKQSKRRGNQVKKPALPDKVKKLDQPQKMSGPRKSKRSGLQKSIKRTSK